MAEISVGEAAVAGLRLIRREPKAVLGWAALYLAVSVGAMALLGGMFAQFFALLAHAETAEPDVADLFGLQMQMMAFQPLFTLGLLVLQTVMMGAVFRAVLQPDERRWAYLRLSSQELWLGLVYVVLSFGIGLSAMALLFPVAGIAAFVGLAFQESLGPWAMVLVGAPGMLAVAAVVIWVMLRLSLAYPMSFADRNFRLFESWAATRGHTGRLFLVFVLAVLLVLAIELVAFLAGAGVIVAVIGPNWQRLVSGDPLLLYRAAGPLVGALMVVGSALSAVIVAIATAPLAEVYRQLTSKSA